MIQLNITYYPGRWFRWLYVFRFKVFNGVRPLEYQRTVPGKWDEFTLADIRAVAKAVYLLRDKTVQKIFIAWHFLSLPFPVFRNMSYSDVLHVYRHLSSLLEENTLAKTLLKQVSIRGTVFLGPGDFARNMTFLEFIKADTFYCQYKANPSAQALNNLAATLYRPRRSDVDEKDVSFNGDMRIPFNEYQVAARAKTFRSLSRVDRYVILMQYAGLRAWLQRKYPETLRYNKPGQFGWAGLIVSLAGPKFGDDDHVANKFIHAILTHMEMSMIEANKTRSK